MVEKGAISLFGNFIQNNLKGKVQYDAMESSLFITPPTKKTQDQFKKTRALLDEMNSYLKSKNIKFVVAIIPLDYQVDEGRKQAFIKNNLENMEFDIGQPQKYILQWASRNNVNAIDLMAELGELEKEDDLYWKLNGHFNKIGNGEAGGIIYNYLTSKRIIIN